ncbi:MAG TPA: STAS domain-containing protein [Dongiaceae bacterium]|nr:STAS domain-containing protein [Dongiaceae bacterium]
MKANFAMSVSSAKISVFVDDRFACVRIVGRPNFTSSVDFKTLLNELYRKGCERFLLDLSECRLMDSTFLGVLAGFGLKLREAQKEPPCLSLELLNPNARIAELLENLGILRLVTLRNGSLPAPAGTQTDVLAPAEASREDIARACLEAHETLMKLNPDNIARFKDVAQFLAEDLKKLGAPPK